MINPLDVMPLLYGLLVGGMLALALFLFLTWYLVDRKSVILSLAALIFIDALTLLVLAMATGNEPYLSLDDFRQLIVILRFVLLIALVVTLRLQVRRLRELKRKQ